MTSISVERAFDMRDRVLLVTGGAAGIGLETATLFAEQGARVVLLDRAPASTIAVLAASLPGGPHLGLSADVTDAVSVEAVIEQALTLTGRIDVLINSAGIVRLAPAAELSTADWDAVIAVNLTASFVVAQAVGRRMLAQGSGRIVNLASQAALVALDQHVAYCASKAAVVAITKVLALEWGPHGITVNCISPTVVETELGRLAWAGAVGDAMRGRIPTRRFARPDEIAAAALYLAGGAAGMINGENLVIDGGFTIQ